MRLSRFFLLVFPVLVACSEEDGDLGIGIEGDQYTATLAGANVRPVPVTGSGAATATFTVRDPAIGSSIRTVAYTIDVTGLASVTAVHVHLGGAAVADGPLLVSLFSNPSDTAITAGRLTSGSFAETGIGGGVSLDSLTTLMQSGNAYIDVHSRGSSGAVLRGQLVRIGAPPPLDLFAALSLTGAKERPNPVVTTATGSATFELLPGGSVRYVVRVSGLTGTTMAHIHTGVADSAGPIAVPLFSAATPTGPLTGTLASGTFTVTNIQLPGVSFDSLLALMRLGRTYVNVHTVANPAGEIRAQIQPVSVLP
jgi:hypothetical protein